MKLKYIFLLLLILAMRVDGQTFTAGYTFTAGETNITHTKLNSIVSGMTVSDIPGTALANTTITSGKIAANAITTDKVLDQTLLTGDLLTRTLLGSNISTNAITEIELFTNLTFRAGFLNFTNVTVGFPANAIPASSIVNSSFVTNGQIGSSTTYLPASVNSATSYTEIMRVTNTALSGKRIVSGQALYSDTSGSSHSVTAFARLLEVSIDLGTTNIISSGGFSTTAGNVDDFIVPFNSIARTALATNIYMIQGMSNNAADGEQWRNSGSSIGTGTPAFSGATYITIMNTP